MLWEIEFTKEANNDALDSYPYNEEVLIAIESLALTESRIPSNDCLEIESNFFRWTVANHHVFIQRMTKKLRIATIKPIE